MNRNNTKVGKKHCLALIDDDEAARVSISQMFKLRSYNVEVFSSAEMALSWPGLVNMDTIISDIKMPGMNGEMFLDEIKSRQCKLPVIMITGHGDVSMAVRCLKKGAYDFVEKPFEDEVLLASVARAVEKNALQKESDELRHRLDFFIKEESLFGIIGKSRIMQDLFEHIQIVSKSVEPVLLHGETGSGKEMVARAIHLESNRAKKAFIAVNMGALSENLVESELFGHVRGAFTGAISKREGKLVAADRGTLLLDEIESISMSTQIKLLRVLEDGLVFPLGQDKPVKVDVKIIATSKVDLKEQVIKGLMREDFYYRIMVLPVTIPPLRERAEDIPLLLSHFIKVTAERNGIPIMQIPDNILNQMMEYSWPGNIRELKHCVERMIITAKDGLIGPFIMDHNFDSSRLLSLPGTPGKLHDELENVENKVIKACLSDNEGEINPSARDLGISRRALYERMKKYGMNKEDFKRP
ncbi:MAG: sigma-54-dependent Fis family transcriptional regulator [Fibrobacteria bacterium]|nr:sigma-54-dependent Fis family transcriptional regulator [Fibrobacteria bacterium]